MLDNLHVMTCLQVYKVVNNHNYTSFRLHKFMFYFEFNIIVSADARVQNNNIASTFAMVVTAKTSILRTNMTR